MTCQLNMKRILLSSLLIFFILKSFAQPLPEQDCINAIPILEDTLIQTYAYSGQGNIPNEINGQFSCLIIGEKNDVWYSYCVKSSGNLCFSLVPVDNTADFDWAVFDLTSHTCDEIYYDSTLEVSCNFSSVPGITGANGMPGTQNEPCIQVQAGERYAINISQFTLDATGYTLYFNASSSSPDTTCSFQPDSCNIDAGIVTQNLACPGDSNGTAFALVFSGLSPFSYVWSNGQTSNINSNLSAGIYSVSITDGIGCIYIRQTTITEPAPVSITMNSYSASSDSACNGQAVANVSGGTPPYSFLWSEGTTWSSGSTSGTYVCAGTYFLTITDSNNCTSLDSVEIYVTSIKEKPSAGYFKISPNPFNHKTTIEFSLFQKNKLKITIFNLLGEIAEERVLNEIVPGTNSIVIGETLKHAGTYFVKITFDKVYFVERLVKLQNQ